MPSPLNSSHLTNPTPHTIPHVFVYGTLKPGGRYHSVAQRGGHFTSQDAYIEGFTLYHLEPEGYPAITRGQGKVHGNVFTFENIKQALPLLDELEGCHWDPPEYERIKTTAYPLDEEVWAYLYLDQERLRQPGVKRLENGLWRVDLHS